MTLNELKNNLEDFAKDIKLNLSSLLISENYGGLNKQQIWLLCLACSYASKNTTLISAAEKEASSILEQEQKDAAKTAAVLMAMNNTYYRYIHSISEQSYHSMPTGLRMNGLLNPKIGKINFELCCLAISSINGCKLCIDSHRKLLEQQNVSKSMIQASGKIAAIIMGCHQALSISQTAL